MGQHSIHPLGRSAVHASDHLADANPRAYSRRVLALVSILLMLALAAIALVSAIIVRSRGNRALEEEVERGVPKRTCPRCGSAELEVSGSSVWCHACGTGG